MSAPQVKYCPRCKTAAELTAPVCASCGRQYRTAFHPQEQTVYGSVPPLPRPSRLPWVLVGFLALVLLAGAGWVLWPRPQQAAYRRPDPAISDFFERLPQALDPGMRHAGAPTAGRSLFRDGVSVQILEQHLAGEIRAKSMGESTKLRPSPGKNFDICRVRIESDLDDTYFRSSDFELVGTDGQIYTGMSFIITTPTEFEEFEPRLVRGGHAEGTVVFETDPEVTGSKIGIEPP